MMVFWMVTPAMLRRLMPKFPSVTILTFLTVTLSPVMSRVPGIYRPTSTAPLPVTWTDPSAVLVQPGPEDTWAGTVFRTVPASTPLFVASGRPHLLGAAAQLVGFVLANDVDGMSWVAISAIEMVPTAIMPTDHASRFPRWRLGCLDGSGVERLPRPVSLVMTCPAFICESCCDNHCSRYAGPPHRAGFPVPGGALSPSLGPRHNGSGRKAFRRLSRASTRQIPGGRGESGYSPVSPASRATKAAACERRCMPSLVSREDT